MFNPKKVKLFSSSLRAFDFRAGLVATWGKTQALLGDRRAPRLFAVRGRLWGWVSAPARVQPECPLRAKRSSPNLRGGSSCSLGGQLEEEGQRQHWKDASELAHGAPPARNCPNLRGQPECPAAGSGDTGWEGRGALLGRRQRRAAPLRCCGSPRRSKAGGRLESESCPALGNGGMGG